MKKNLFFSMLTAVALLVSCSSDNVVENSNNAYNMVEGQPAFISLGIAMPNSTSTRANDNYDDGADAEYAVYSGKLVLFKGSTEASATLFGSYDIPTSVAFAKETGDVANAITSTSQKYVQEIEAPNLKSVDNLYAYVILNNDGNATGIDLSTGQTFASFSKKVFKAIGLKDDPAETKGYGVEGDKGFVMTSVPYSKAAAGTNAAPTGTECTALSKINASAVYDTKAAAEAATAATACIYVERAAVKVDVTFSASITDPAGSSTPVGLVGWGLGNVNNNASGYYNVRQTDNTWLQLLNKQCATSTIKYRFASGSPFFAEDHDMGYRTYWGTDVNYSGNTGLVNGKVEDADYTLASGATTYTYENTIDENSMIYANTTYVGFKTTLNDGTDFYTIDGAHNTAYSEANLLKKLASNVATLKASDIATILATIKTKISSGTTVTLTPVVTLGTYDSATGHVPYTAKLQLTVTAGQAQSEVEALEYETGKTIAQKMDEELTGYTPDVVNKYVGGVTYYAVRIAHFGDTETPWSTANSSYNDYAKIYPTDGQSLDATSVDYGDSRKAAWLGRWGILRNNWYSLEVTDIQGIGDAVPVDYSTTGTGDPGNTPDDNPSPKYYIKAQIHILPWVKRTQTVVL